MSVHFFRSVHISTQSQNGPNLPVWCINHIKPLVRFQSEWLRVDKKGKYQVKDGRLRRCSFKSSLFIITPWRDTIFQVQPLEVRNNLSSHRQSFYKDAEAIHSEALWPCFVWQTYGRSWKLLWPARSHHRNDLLSRASVPKSLKQRSEK